MGKGNKTNKSTHSSKGDTHKAEASGKVTRGSLKKYLQSVETNKKAEMAEPITTSSQSQEAGPNSECPHSPQCDIGQIQETLKTILKWTRT